MGSATGGGPAPQPQTPAPDIAPPALPGAGIPAPMATGPVVAKPNSGDPTTDLFNAIVKGDDSAAQDALGRGANLNAQNQFGETPLDESIALDRTSITFLLLQTRNELAAQGGPAEPLGAPWMLTPTPAPAAPAHGKTSHKPAHATRAVPLSAPASPRVSLPAESGTPDAQAGFLGFGPQKQ